MTRIFHRLFLWKWIPCQPVTSVLCFLFRPKTVHCSTKNTYTSEITFLALVPWSCVSRELCSEEWASMFLGCFGVAEYPPSIWWIGVELGKTRLGGGVLFLRGLKMDCTVRTSELGALCTAELWPLLTVLTTSEYAATTGLILLFQDWVWGPGLWEKENYSTGSTWPPVQLHTVLVYSQDTLSYIHCMMSRKLMTKIPGPAIWFRVRKGLGPHSSESECTGGTDLSVGEWNWELTYAGNHECKKKIL